MSRLQKQALAALVVALATAAAVAALLAHWGDPARAQAGFAILGLSPLVFLVRGESSDPVVSSGANRFASQFRWGYIVVGLSWLVLEGYHRTGIPTAFALLTALLVFAFQRWLASPGQRWWPEYDEREAEVGANAYKLGARVVWVVFAIVGTLIALAFRGASVPAYAFGLQVYVAWWLLLAAASVSVLWQEYRWQK